MRHLQLTLNSPAENLALDEALLDAAEAGACDDDGSVCGGELSNEGVLRLWEPEDYFIVLGRSSDPQQEVDLQACQHDGVPIFRRSSGGAPIVAGPGCLMFAVVLGYSEYPTLRAVDAAHRFVLGTMATALNTLNTGIVQAGVSDLVLPLNAMPTVISSTTSESLLKFSGNSLRCKHSHFLYHGTLMYDFDLERIGRWLKMPIRQPDYRHSRHHTQFVTNLIAARAEIENALIQSWHAENPLIDWPQERTIMLTHEKYSRAEWILSVNPHYPSQVT